jgi:hypothetical protein
LNEKSLRYFEKFSLEDSFNKNELDKKSNNKNESCSSSSSMLSSILNHFESANNQFFNKDSFKKFSKALKCNASTPTFRFSLHSKQKNGNLKLSNAQMQSKSLKETSSLNKNNNNLERKYDKDMITLDNRKLSFLFCSKETEKSRKNESVSKSYLQNYGLTCNEEIFKSNIFNKKEFNKSSTSISSYEELLSEFLNNEPLDEFNKIDKPQLKQMKGKKIKHIIYGLKHTKTRNLSSERIRNECKATQTDLSFEKMINFYQEPILHIKSIEIPKSFKLVENSFFNKVLNFGEESQEVKKVTNKDKILNDSCPSIDDVLNNFCKLNGINLAETSNPSCSSRNSSYTIDSFNSSQKRFVIDKLKNLSLDSQTKIDSSVGFEIFKILKKNFKKRSNSKRDIMDDEIFNFGKRSQEILLPCQLCSSEAPLLRYRKNVNRQGNNLSSTISLPTRF